MSERMHYPAALVSAPFFVDLSANELRAAIGSHELRDYETIDIEVKLNESNPHPQLQRIISEGWSLASGTIPSVVPPVEWDGHDRSFMFHLHAWEPVNLLLRGYALTKESAYFDYALQFGLDWMSREMPTIVDVLLHSPRADAEALLDNLSSKDRNFRWYDMAVGQRLYRIAYLLDRAVRLVESNDDDLVALHRALHAHFLVLSRDQIFRPATNHGVFQALCQLAAAKRFSYLPGVTEFLSQAWERVAIVIDAQFFPSGCHREHSTGYHFMMLNTLLGARDCGIIERGPVADLIANAENILSWMVKPNAMLAPLGDTDERYVARGEEAARRYADPKLQFLVSGGWQGKAHPAGMRAMLEEGYLFARSEDKKAWWYLAQTAGFHSRTHKQADDLSFVWSDNGKDILVDPGRYAYAGRTDKGSDLFKAGFWYSDPRRIYVESTRAHNALEIDGKSYSRTRTPYGSALRYGGMQDGLVVSECEVHHFRTVRHWRVLILKPGHFLVVVDWALDRSGSEHDFRQYFQFAPSWSASPPAGECLPMVNGMSTLGVLALVPEQGAPSVVRGQETPELQGWFSDRANSLIPSPSVMFEQRRSEYALFATLFTFGTDAKRLPGMTKLRRSMRPATLAWKEGRSSFSLDISRGAEGTPVTVSVREDPV